MSRTMFEVQCSKPKIGVRVRLPKVEHVQCLFDVQSIVQRTFSETQITTKYTFFKYSPKRPATRVKTLWDRNTNWDRCTKWDRNTKWDRCTF